jgi:hypothetical protein
MTLIDNEGIYFEFCFLRDEKDKNKRQRPGLSSFLDRLHVPLKMRSTSSKTSFLTIDKIRKRKSLQLVLIGRSPVVHSATPATGTKSRRRHIKKWEV